MSRSIHKTVNGVFGGKSASEMDRVLEENDPDVQELGKKYRYKSEERARRKVDKSTENSEIESQN